MSGRRDIGAKTGAGRGVGACTLVALFLALSAAPMARAGDVHEVALQRADLAFLRALYREPGMLDVSLKRYAGSLLLIGSVPTEAARSRAEEIARDSLDGGALRNRLSVVPVQKGHDAPVADAILQARIEAAIEGDAELGADRRRLVIRVEEARASLGGEIDGPQRARSLVDLVRVVPGLAALDFSELAY